MSPNFDPLESLAPTRKKRNFCGNKDSAFHPMPMSVTVDTKRNQILQCIMAELTPGVLVMDLQHLRGTAILASPSIPV